MQIFNNEKSSKSFSKLSRNWSHWFNWLIIQQAIKQQRKYKLLKKKKFISSNVQIAR